MTLGDESRRPLISGSPRGAGWYERRQLVQHRFSANDSIRRSEANGARPGCPETVSSGTNRPTTRRPAENSRPSGRTKFQVAYDNAG
jgi:hypothetical protein